MKIRAARAAILALVVALSCDIAGALAQAPGDWPAYGRDAGGSRFSPLTRITTANVATLQHAWIYRTGDFMWTRGRFEATPLLVDGTLYLATPLGRVVALDPASGAERWVYDARVDFDRDYGDFANRGVSMLRDPAAPPSAARRRRVFL